MRTVECKSFGRGFLKMAIIVLTSVSSRHSILLHAGVCTYLRVGPLGLDLLSHLLSAAQQVVPLPTLQVEQQINREHNGCDNLKNNTCIKALFVLLNTLTSF